MPRLVPPVVEAGSIGGRDQPTISVGDDTELRPWVPADAPVVLRAFADPDIQRWNRRRLDTLAEAEEWIATTETGWRTETVATWAIVDRSDPTVHGRVSLYFHDLGDGLGEVTYWVLPEARGRDFAGRAARAACDWAFRDVGLHRIEVAHSVHNAASCRVAAKAGFTAEGTRTSALLHEDGWHDMHVHARIGPPRDGPAVSGLFAPTDRPMGAR